MVNRRTALLGVQMALMTLASHSTATAPAGTLGMRGGAAPVAALGKLGLRQFTCKRQHTIGPFRPAIQHACLDPLVAGNKDTCIPPRAAKRFSTTKTTLSFISLSGSHTKQTARKLTTMAGDNEDFYGLKVKDYEGKDFDFATLRGKVVLIVNVASKCGFTPQYKGLEELYKKYSDKGLVILGFPCNQFGGQEPGTNEEVAQFCSLKYDVTFPIMEKSDVNGDKENPVYKYIKVVRPGLLGLKRIKWNFEKFLVDKHGSVAERWASTTTPAGIEDTIKEYLDKE